LLILKIKLRMFDT